jgi:HEAT repeat protein
MRTYLIVGAVVGMILVGQAGALRGDPGKETDAERIARLIKQLGDDSFATREAASKELKGIGAPAVAALRKASASSDDPEIRLRAKRIEEAITGAAAKAELAKLQASRRFAEAAATMRALSHIRSVAGKRNSFAPGR